MNWTGNGTMAAGDKTIITSAVTSVSLSDGSAKTLRRVLENHSTINGTNGDINVGGGTLNNGTLSDPTGTINATLTSNHVFQDVGGGGTLNNAGTFNKAGAATLSVNAGAFNNTATGTVNLDAGAMNIIGGGTNSAQIDADAGTQLIFSNNYTHAAASSLTGPGRLTFSGGTHTIAAGT